MGRSQKYPDELIDRGVRLALERGRPIAHVASDFRGREPRRRRAGGRDRLSYSGRQHDVRVARGPQRAPVYAV